MLADYRPVTLSAAARTLGVEPFEVVRLMVVSGAARKDEAASSADAVNPGELTPPQIEALRAWAGVETWWEGPIEVAEDAVGTPGERDTILRAVLAEMLRRGQLGDARTRQDNLWRGLPKKQRRVIDEGIDALVGRGILQLRHEARGLLVSLRPEAEERVRAIVDGGELPDEN